MRAVVCLILVAVVVAAASWVQGQEQSAADKGRTALTTRSFTTAVWSVDSYGKAWQQWQPKPNDKPAAYDQAFAEYYGLHPAPYENAHPMGLRIGAGLIGKGLTSDCLMCHGGSIAGKSYIGLGNSSLDVEALFLDLTRATGLTNNLPFTFSNARGTSEAGTMAIYLLALRDDDLNLLGKPLNFGLRDNLCEDAPAWWLLKKKKTMYHTGTTNSRSVRSLMQFALSPPSSPAFFAKEEATFRDIQAYILSLTPPKYPLTIDQPLAAKGEVFFNQVCSKCHGGDKWTYPNKIVPLAEIGTDTTRFEGLPTAWAEHYNKNWFSKETGVSGTVLPSVGYQAPPLDGVWATAPYLHNGSVPTIYHMLNSKARPKIFTRSFKTELDAYDSVNLGWKVTVLERGADTKLPPIERRKIYDTTQPGRGNGGHTFGDDLTDDERRAIIEYLKTL